MTREERIQIIKAMPISPDRYWAAYCHEVMDHIEIGGFYEICSEYQVKQFQKGIKKFFNTDTTIRKDLTLTL